MLVRCTNTIGQNEMVSFAMRAHCELGLDRALSLPTVPGAVFAFAITVWHDPKIGQKTLELSYHRAEHWRPSLVSRFCGNFALRIHRTASGDA